MSAFAARNSVLRHSVNAMIGELIGARYKVINVLGSGGFGHTYIAEDTQRPGNPRCCMKHLTFNSSDPKVLQQVRRLFQSEAEMLEQLGMHDQIPRLLAYFEENQQFYLVQEFIEGHPLSQELGKGVQISEDEVIPLLEDVLSILEFVHAQGAVHRDIKPANLIRRRQDSRLVLIDFGAVKLIGSTVAEVAGETSLSMPVYTSGYAASEQCLGRPRFCSDLYSLGMVGIQALTGLHPAQLPHDYGTSEVIWRDRAAVSDELATVLETMTRYHFADRYQSASEALKAVRQVISTAPTLVAATPRSLPETLPTVRPPDVTHPPATAMDSVTVAQKSPVYKSLSRAGLALLGTFAIAVLVRSLADVPFPLSLSTPPTVNSSETSDRVSTGDKLLNKWQLVPKKQEGIDHLAAKRYDAAISALEAAHQETTGDPETLIYLNNARIGDRQSYAIAIAAPLETTLGSALEMLRGVAKAQDDINRQGGINGVPLKVAIADDANRPDLAQSIAETLAKDPTILGVIGHGSSDTTLKAAAIYQANQLVLVTPVSSAVTLSTVGDFVFRTMPSDHQTAKALKDYMLARLKQRKVVIFHSSGSQYSQSLRGEFKDALDYSGVQGVQVIDEVDFSRPDFDAEDSVNQAIAKGAQVLMLAPDDKTMDRAIRVIETNNRRLAVLGGDSMFTIRVPKTLKDRGAGTVLAVPIEPTGTPFAQQSALLWGDNSLTTWRTALAYDATEALIAAIRREPSRVGIRRIMAESTFSTEGAKGLVSFQLRGERQKAPSYVTIAPIANTTPKRYGFKPVETP